MKVKNDFGISSRFINTNTNTVNTMTTTNNSNNYTFYTNLQYFPSKENWASSVSKSKSNTKNDHINNLRGLNGIVNAETNNKTRKGGDGHDVYEIEINGVEIEDEKENENENYDANELRSKASTYTKSNTTNTNTINTPNTNRTGTNTLSTGTGLTPNNLIVNSLSGFNEW